LNINRDLINKSGERTAEALIKDLPIANGGGVPISNNGTGFTPGATAVSLRGLGPQATLLLIDGRRVAPYPIGNNGTSSFFDLRSIPEAGIESIEVLKDGASTTYGADAVAGVINIKLRHDYKGVQAQVAYGNTLDKDSGEIRANVVFGIGDGNTNVTGVINYYHRNSLYNRDRGYSAVPIFLSTNSTPENLSLTFDQVVAAGHGHRLPVGLTHLNGRFRPRCRHLGRRPHRHLPRHPRRFRRLRRNGLRREVDGQAR
jgi:outer membrane receptor protein involved in Fe transport